MKSLTLLKNNFKSDLLSGFILSLIALPLCIGIAGASLGNSMASPAIAGLAAAIIGGLLVSRLAGSHITIHGPAAGMIVVVQHGILALGSLGLPEFNAAIGFQRFLAAMILAGILQFLLGVFKLARYAALFPVNVIHGMLAAIGVIIISKQVHVALGVTPISKSSLALYAEIPNSLMNLNPEIAIIGGATLLLLILLRMIKNPLIKKIPAPIAAVLLAVTLGLFFDLTHDHPYMFMGKEYLIGEKFLVSLPKDILSALPRPDFSVLLTSTNLGVVFSIFFVASLESLLSANAVDKLDSQRRKTNLNTEIMANGVGNSLLGFIGGLPIIAEIVRSSANISYNAKTSWSNFFHGAFLLIFILFIPGYIHLIPNAALAAILIMVGFNLAKPSEFKHALQVGWEQLVFFATTLVVTVADDLLVGVAAGLIVKLIYLFAQGVSFKDIFKARFTEQVDKSTVKFNVTNSLIFTNLIKLTDRISETLKNSDRVEVDFKNTRYVDHTSITTLSDLQEEINRAKKELVFTGLDQMRPVSKHPHSARRAVKK